MSLTIAATTSPIPKRKQIGKTCHKEVVKDLSCTSKIIEKLLTVVSFSNSMALSGVNYKSERLLASIAGLSPFQEACRRPVLFKRRRNRPGCNLLYDLSSATHGNEKNDSNESKNDFTSGIFALFINKRKLSIGNQTLMSKPPLRTVDAQMKK
jgi:hypothetical protein